MENIFHRQSHSMEPNVMKSSSSGREPLRQRSMNSQPRSSSGKDAIAKFPLQQRSTNAMPSSREQFSQKPSSSSSHRSSKSSSSSRSEPVEIVERRKRSDGEGYTYHRYTRGKMLGKGGFAKVYLCTAMDTERQYAVKIVPKANLTKQRARQKVSFLIFMISYFFLMHYTDVPISFSCKQKSRFIDLSSILTFVNSSTFSKITIIATSCWSYVRTKV